MRENFLHYIWKFQKFDILHLKTIQGESISLVSVGIHNHDSGPDFFNAQLKIGEQLWAGNVEIHIKSSDWFAHHHEQDKAYDNVILHVVYEHDSEVYRKDNSIIPTLELKHYIHKGVLQNYKKLFSNTSKWINCENDFAKTEDFILDHWLERLYIERLERKSKTIEALLEASNNNWEAVLFKMLTKYFGLKVNGDAFFSLANSLDFSIVRKIQSNQLLLEALLFGQAGLLEKTIEDTYYQNLKSEYYFLKQKFQLSNEYVLPLQFFRLRPSNFPTIRLSQLARLYHKQQRLFSKLLVSETLEDFYKLFEVTASPYWNSHYTFQKESKTNPKIVTKAFVNLLLINTIIPLKFSYAKQNGKAVNEQLIQLIRAIDSENNSIIKSFNKLKKISKSALDSQALVQLKTEYCNKHQCLKCAIGNSLLA
ncbi:DUF2851 family protein [Psychroserpens ponticola]|uniref:DUF2851 family protein n=1 Tax=Psychroserpens ponticola TaxID=2932268 RepID=A0ABY7RUJ9_9FLAO|nr:DUF2851 family protein [Psychroserpens ponticola]WCO00809.1 DUF2851 family protein [Psychroserpens ponticola]